MKRSKTFFGPAALALFLAVLICAPTPADAKGVDDTLRHNRALEDLQKSRAKKVEQAETGAQVRAPDATGAKSPRNLVDTPVGAASELLANLTGREVMVSARVSARKISVTGEGLSEKDFIAALRKALAAADVRFTELGKHSIALTDARD